MPSENPEPPELTEIIESALLKGATRAVISLELARQAHANGTKPPSNEEINAAYAAILDRWVEDGNQDEDESYAYHVRMRKHLYQKSFALNDFKTCLAIAADLADVEERHRAYLAKAEKAKRLGLFTGAGKHEGQEAKTNGTKNSRGKPGAPADQQEQPEST
jgi:hypothetical protein